MALTGGKGETQEKQANPNINAGKISEHLSWLAANGKKSNDETVEKSREMPSLSP
jgi:hypothetical protein